MKRGYPRGKVYAGRYCGEFFLSVFRKNKCLPLFRVSIYVGKPRFQTAKTILQEIKAEEDRSWDN